MKKIILILLILPSIAFSQKKELPNKKYLIDIIEKNMEGVSAAKCEKLKLKTEIDGFIHHIIKIDDKNFQVLAVTKYYCEKDQYRNYVWKSEIKAFFKLEKDDWKIIKIMDPEENSYYRTESQIKN